MFLLKQEEKESSIRGGKAGEKAQGLERRPAGAGDPLQGSGQRKSTRSKIQPNNNTQLDPCSNTVPGLVNERSRAESSCEPGFMGKVMRR